MLVRDVMTAPVVTVHADDGLDDAARLLREHGVRSLPVVDDDGHLLGMVTDTDVVRDAVSRNPWARDLHPSAGGPHPVSVRDVMSHHPVAVHPYVELPVAAELLVSGLTSLPVVEEGAVVGILTRRDLVAVVAPPAERADPGHEFQWRSTGSSRS